MLHDRDAATTSAAPTNRDAPAPAAAPTSALRGMSFAAGAAALAPVQARPTPAPAAAGTLTDAQVKSAVAYNRARPISHAQWQTVQRTVGTAADGDVGPNTVRAVARWQAAQGLEVDGKVGPATFARIQGAGGGGGQAGALSPSQVTAAVRYNQGRGFSGDAVRQIQAKVGAEVDGDFGPNTVRAVARWQAGRGMEVDGKVGPSTASALGVQAGGGGQAPVAGSNAAKLGYAKRRAVAIGLTITSTTGGRHAPNSYHYSGRAIDVAGSASKMAQFYREMATMSPTELFYDPLGGIKHGREIGAIGNHSDHVHVAF